MQRNKLIKICLSLLIGVILFLVSKSEVKVSIFGEDIRVRSDYQCLECGPYWPACWDEFCDEYNCPFGCLSEDCNGGVCITCSECGIYPHCWSEYCSSSCTYGCSSEGCYGGVCEIPPECADGRTKCEGTEYSKCVNESWVFQYNCYLGCSGDVCSSSLYCVDSDCGCTKVGNPLKDNPGAITIICYKYPGSSIVESETCSLSSSCDLGVCNPYTGTCGGTISEATCDALYPGMNYVSHIDNCGGMGCGPPCTGGGGDDGSDDGSCIAQYPGKPTLLLPVDGGMSEDDVTLSWSRSGYGIGCPENSDSQDLYLEAGDSSPDVKIADLGSTDSSYGVSDLDLGTVYYWRLVVNNGDLSMSSDVFSFKVNGLIEGYLFDSGGMSVCPADLSDPVYDSRKIGGGLLDVTGTTDYLDVTSIADGSYSQTAGTPGSYVLGNFRLGSGFISTPDLICDGTSVEFVVGGAGTTIRSFGFLRDYDGWWQGVGGDVYGGLGLESTIPATCVAGVGCEPYLVASDGNGESGLVRYMSGGVELGDNELAAVNADGWVVNSGYAGQDTNYAYYNSKLALIEKTSWAGSGKPVFNPQVGSDYEIYVYTGTGTIDFDVAAGEKMIFMVGGDVDVTSNVDVAEGGHLAVIASGSITFASDVSQVEGWWVGDSLSIESTGNTGTELVFRGEGSFVGWNGVSLNRDRGESNATEPAEEFVFRSDLMINAPIALKFSRYVWQEKAPN